MQTITAIYHSGLVALSIITVIVTLYATLELVRQIAEASGNVRRLWLAAGATTMGIGIWSMHFIGMLALMLPITVSYDTTITFVSLLIAIAVSALALRLVSGVAMGRCRWLVGGTLMGLGIAAMHYVGMAAVRMEASMRYDPLLLMLSIAVAIAVALLALQLIFRLGRRRWRSHRLLKLGAAAVMGLAIAGMHYIGMAAMHIEVTISVGDGVAGFTRSQIWLSVVLAASNLLILGTALIITLLDRQILNKLFSSRSLLARNWLLVAALLYILAFWLLEATLHALLLSDQDGAILEHLFTRDPKEIWMRLVVTLTAFGFATVGQRMFSLSKAFNHELVEARDHLEETVSQRTTKLAESEERVRGIIDTSHDAFVAINSKGQIVDWNPAASNLFGWEYLEVMGQSVDELLFPQEPTTLLTQASQSALNSLHELNASHRSGEAIAVELSISSLQQDGGVVYNMFIRDVSARKRTEQEMIRAKHVAEQANQMKSEFLANMSHELRTPLNAILGFTEVVKDGHAGAVNEMQCDYLGEVFDSSNHLLALISDILDLSKVEAGKMTLALQNIELQPLLQSSLTIIKEKAHSHSIKLELSIDDNVGWARLDERKFKQILYNLLSNAVKFTPDGGRVGITAHAAGEWFEVTVWDTGIGIAVADQERLFHPFEQVDGSMARKYEGTGLGLALVRSFACLHGGEVTLASVVGEGSRFTVRMSGHNVKADSTTTALQEAKASNVTSSSEASPLILLVEDNDQAAALMMAQLKHAGYRTQWARSGEEGVRLAQALRPALVLLDIMLPTMDGWAVLEQFKASADLVDIPVTVVSIVADSNKGLTLGALDVLQKPIGRDELLSAVSRAVPRQSNAAQKVRVMVVDDDPNAVELVTQQLRSQGYQTIAVDGGVAALEQIAKDLPELIILDLMMPEVTGFDVLVAMREQTVTAEVPVIILTAKTLTDDEQRFLARHTAEVVAKTDFESELFMSLVNKSLRGQ